MDQLMIFNIKRSAMVAHFKNVFRSLDLNHNNVCKMRLIDMEVALYEMKESHEDILQLNKNIELILLRTRSIAELIADIAAARDRGRQDRLDYLQVLNFATKYINEFETDATDAIVLKQEYADITVFQNIMGELERPVIEAVTGMKLSTENLTTLIAILAEQLDQSINKNEDHNNDIINEDETTKGNSPVTLSSAKVGSFNQIVTGSLIGVAGRFDQNSSKNIFQSDNGGHVDQIRRPALSLSKQSNQEHYQYMNEENSETDFHKSTIHDPSFFTKC